MASSVPGRDSEFPESGNLLWLVILRRLLALRISRIGLMVFLGAVCQPGYMALITQYNPVQSGTNTIVRFDVTNESAGTTFDSAFASLDLTLGEVADYISANSLNPTYAGKSRADIMQSWNGTILPDPSGEVNDGWINQISAGNDLQLAHSGSYENWSNSTDNPSLDTMALRLDMFDSLDLNVNGQFDAATETLYKTSTTVPAFEAQLTTGSQDSAICKHTQ